MTTKSLAWYAERYVTKYGFVLVPALPMHKAPFAEKGKNWIDNALRTADDAVSFYAANPKHNMGFSLGDSRFCSLDIDCLESWLVIAEYLGIDLTELDNVPTIQGSNKGKRLVFKQPNEPLPYHKLSWPMEHPTRPNEQYAVFEIRSGTDSQRFDVLPPSIHPETKQPYKWIVQPTATLDDWPEPPEWLLTIWREWDKFKPQIQAACPWIAPQAPMPTTTKRQYNEQPGGNSARDVVDAFNAAHDLENMLQANGYKRKADGRYLSPHSKTKLAGVHLFDDGRACWIHHASDPLCSDDTGQPVSAFDLFAYYEHQGDNKAAIKAAAALLGMERKTARQQAIETAQAAPAVEVIPANAQQVEVLPSEPFKPLGFDDDKYFYLPRNTEQVAVVARGKHTSPSELLALASIEWWSVKYPKGGDSTKGVDWQLAGSDLMRQCERVGVYSGDNIRGRGAWYDDGQPVMHRGDHLIVGTRPEAISTYRSRYIYARQAPIELGREVPEATDAEAAEVVGLFEQLAWSKPIHGQLMAGFVALAPICGGLTWRPHVWLSARRGAGKTWVQENLVAPLLGSIALQVQGSTSEAGIRQALGQDARPVLFDEAESEDQNAQRRMQAVIELARQSSSDSSARILKGTVNGTGMGFRARSMFLMTSINVVLRQAADESRFSVLTLERDNRGQSWFDQYARQANTVLTPARCQAIRQRVFLMMPLIRHNAGMLALAVARKVGSRRIGDQYGTLLAGWYALQTKNALTEATADLLIADMDFTDAHEADQVSDEERCLQHILQAGARITTLSGSVEYTIGELVEIAAGKGDGTILQAEANLILSRHGLRVDGNTLQVANSHSALSKILESTPWGAGWRRILGRIEGATGSGVLRFAGSTSRAVVIPLQEVL